MVNGQLEELLTAQELKALVLQALRPARTIVRLPGSDALTGEFVHHTKEG